MESATVPRMQTYFPHIFQTAVPGVGAGVKYSPTALLGLFRASICIEGVRGIEVRLQSIC